MYFKVLFNFEYRQKTLQRAIEWYHNDPEYRQKAKENAKRYNKNKRSS